MILRLLQLLPAAFATQPVGVSLPGITSLFAVAASALHIFCYRPSFRFSALIVLRVLGTAAICTQINGWIHVPAVFYLLVLSATDDIYNTALLTSFLSISISAWLLLPLLCTISIPRSILASHNSEQRASIMSIITSTYTQPYIISAWRNPALFHLDISELASYDRVEHLCDKLLPYLDPLSPLRKFNNIALNIIYVYVPQYITLCVLVCLNSAASFLYPLSIHGLLESLHHPQNSTDKIVWIGLLFVGPIAMSILQQLYFTITTRLLLRTDSVICVLLYKHALRVRGIESGKLMSL